MGWSCTAAADSTLEAIFEACKQAGGAVMNDYAVNGKEYMIETRRLREYEDGRICASIFRIENGLLYRSGSLRIDGDGVISRIPAGLWKLLCEQNAGVGKRN